MTRRRPCPAAPGSLAEYAARFDDLFGSLEQRQGFREYLAEIEALGLDLLELESSPPDPECPALGHHLSR